MAPIRPEQRSETLVPTSFRPFFFPPSAAVKGPDFHVSFFQEGLPDATEYRPREANFVADYLAGQGSSPVAFGSSCHTGSSSYELA